ncbi:MAG TPA: RdgB/HAM1 family non-canonical purine NTP pyrophosphatase [Phycisphaerales bacterium]|nr:RdgB/HAM1 family non-canonical purine NTP pyrophosphatase [Phycisphaerales bacterium]
MAREAASPGPVVLATGNPHKVAELRAIFARHGVSVAPLTEVPGGAAIPEPRETGTTFEENARLKAAWYARHTGRLCVADDSGLEIDALGGRPGVISSHYASDGRETGIGRAERDSANNRRVLRELEGVAPERRTARFVCVMALAGPDGAPRRVTRGVLHGRIGVPPRVPAGANGFGYDPLFLVAPELARTSAELSAEEKNRISHRAVAAEAMARALAEPGSAGDADRATVRAATPADLDGIFAIYDREVLHGTSTFETEPKTPAQRTAWLTEHDPGRYPVLVAETQGRVAGWARLQPWSTRCAYARAAENSVYVHPDFRGRGTGRLLMGELIRGAPAAGVWVILARVVEGNPASLRLHEALGFETIGVMRRVGEKFGRVLDVRLLDLHLDKPAPAVSSPSDPGTTPPERR